MTDVQRRTAAAKFVADWKGRGDEKQETQSFWLSLLQKVFGVEEPEKYIAFEFPVEIDNHTKYIDGYIAETKVLIEQKSFGVDLKRGYLQSDGSILSPYNQAFRYAGRMKHDLHPRWIIVCNFGQFEIHDMNRPNDDAEIVLLENLPQELYRLQFLVDTGNEQVKKEMEVSLQAGELVGVLYDALLKQYKEPDNPETLKSLNKLCVRLVFCLYAEDAGIFGRRNMFHDYLKNHRTEDRRALINLFRVLNQDIPQRDKYLDDDLAAFPYVNGGLFADENIEIPRLGDEVIDLILNRASEDFDWSNISPTIFGAVFESTLNPETRRSGGMHYTSIENIHRVIDPLFLDELKQELNGILARPRGDTWWRRYLQAFQEKLAKLKFLDPACGSGNFLTETYLSLRRLENRVILSLNQDVEGQMGMSSELGAEFIGSPIQVSIGQFYGIEINDFAVTVAKTALWIAESQMMKETEDIIRHSLDFLPLKSYANITEGNALRIDWESVVPKSDLNYIMGNPPFLGKKEQSKEQKADLFRIYGKSISGVGNMDYVTAWYVKAAEYMQHTNISAAFVSTNSISQGEQPSVLWKKLTSLDAYILFAYRSFVWSSESAEKAAVHCVIIGFRVTACTQRKRIYSDLRYTYAENINPYILDAPTVIISSRSKPICDVPSMCYGSMPIDNNNLILDEAALQELLSESPDNEMFVREYVGGDELLKGKKRWCLWLVDIDPALYIKSKFIMRRIDANRNYRLHGSDRPQTNRAAETPHLFGEIRQPENGALVVPKVSSEDRRYIPISYVKPGIIINGSALMIPDASMYHFGILSSNVHNAWMRVVAGRLEMRYQYSASIVYNNFVWPKPTEAQRKLIEQKAAGVLAARERHTNVTLASMYKGNNFLSFSDLKTAHDDLNRAVMQAYGFGKQQNSESACVAELMRMYQAIVSSNLR